MKEFLIDAKIENLDVVQSFIEEELEAAECPLKLMTQISIAVEEIFVNIAHYAYCPEVGGVVIRIRVGDDITIEFEDKGKPFNPLENDDPDITVGAEEREIGGLGFFMVKNIMDNVDYKHESGKNILTISKKM